MDRQTRRQACSGSGCAGWPSAAADPCPRPRPPRAPVVPRILHIEGGHFGSGQAVHAQRAHVGAHRRANVLAAGGCEKGGREAGPRQDSHISRRARQQHAQCGRAPHQPQGRPAAVGRRRRARRAHVPQRRAVPRVAPDARLEKHEACRQAGMTPTRSACAASPQTFQAQPRPRPPGHQGAHLARTGRWAHRR